ncbi:hypothetical protein DBV15_07247 [Temnothorax longispinosus]|uniref:Uncharacterized protein n=1 Tax=Temnothorax longispinosus TaxID=300112 RepID=A0A4S2JNJ0_9HYME|nr:hypothetical protein DBV15_07247 [Temnothorax longispinosus]
MWDLAKRRELWKNLRTVSVFLPTAEDPTEIEAVARRAKNTRRRSAWTLISSGAVDTTRSRILFPAGCVGSASRSTRDFLAGHDTVETGKRRRRVKCHGHHVECKIEPQIRRHQRRGRTDPSRHFLGLRGRSHTAREIERSTPEGGAKKKLDPCQYANKIALFYEPTTSFPLRLPRATHLNLENRNLRESLIRRRYIPHAGHRDAETGRRDAGYKLDELRSRAKLVEFSAILPPGNLNLVPRRYLPSLYSRFTMARGRIKAAAAAAPQSQMLRPWKSKGGSESVRAEPANRSHGDAIVGRVKLAGTKCYLSTAITKHAVLAIARLYIDRKSSDNERQRRHKEATKAKTRANEFSHSHAVEESCERTWKVVRLHPGSRRNFTSECDKSKKTSALFNGCARVIVYLAAKTVLKTSLCDEDDGRHICKIRCESSRNRHSNPGAKSLWWSLKYATIVTLHDGFALINVRELPDYVARGVADGVEERAKKRWPTLEKDLEIRSESD